jgi:Mn2+/Fe2+ NRAMP family transporter
MRQSRFLYNENPDSVDIPERGMVVLFISAREEDMITRKTVFSSLSVLVTALVICILARDIVSLANAIGKAATFSLSIGLATLIGYVLLAVLFCPTVWLVLVWDSGDKIPAFLMLLLGVAGLVLYYLVAVQDLNWHTALWVDLFAEMHAYALSALFIAFGIAGLFTKRNPK